MSRSTVILSILVVGLLILAPTLADEKKVSEEAIARTRQTIKLLDDVHKGYVVHITSQYVKARETRPAASVAKKVFQHLSSQGWGSTRLVDATGDPINPKNAAETKFEKQAIDALKKGKTWFEEVGNAKGKPVLRAATPVPVVMKACITCHADQKMGELLGALVYEIPIR